MKANGVELAAAKTAIRQRHGCDSSYVGSHGNLDPREGPVVHEFVLDDPASTAYVWFRKAEVCVVLKGPNAASPSAATMSHGVRGPR